MVWSKIKSLDLDLGDSRVGQPSSSPALPWFALPLLQPTRVRGSSPVLMTLGPACLPASSGKGPLPLTHTTTWYKSGEAISPMILALVWLTYCPATSLSSTMLPSKVQGLLSRVLHLLRSRPSPSAKMCRASSPKMPRHGWGKL